MNQSNEIKASTTMSTTEAEQCRHGNYEIHPVWKTATCLNCGAKGEMQFVVDEAKSPALQMPGYPKYTKGPWQITKVCEGNYQIEREHGTNQIEVIATVILKENAQLISHLPRLLDAAINVNALSIQTDSHKALRKAINEAIGNKT